MAANLWAACNNVPGALRAEIFFFFGLLCFNTLSHVAPRVHPNIYVYIAIKLGYVENLLKDIKRIWKYVRAMLYAKQKLHIRLHIKALCKVRLHVLQFMCVRFCAELFVFLKSKWHAAHYGLNRNGRFIYKFYSFELSNDFHKYLPNIFHVTLNKKKLK